MSQTEIKNFFDALAPSWDQRETADKKRLVSLLDQIGLKEGDKVLDLGCGTGIISDFLYQKTKKQVTAIDLSEKMIELAKAKKIPGSHVRFECRDFFAYEGRDFDEVVIFNAYPHFLDLDRFKRTLLRVLAPEGRFIILHNLSRHQLHCCHSGDAALISRELLDPITEGMFYEDEFEIEKAMEGDDFYLLIGKKLSLKKPTLSPSVMKQYTKREEKTLAKIYEAFSELLKTKGFDKLTIQDILTEADVSRSTFYSHFKSKEEIVDSIPKGIFAHVFSAHQEKEENHDFSSSSVFDYHVMLVHLFYHFQEEKNWILPILHSSAKDRFLKDVYQETETLMRAILLSGKFHKNGVEEELQKEELQLSFASLLSYWFEKEEKKTPEEMASIFEKLHN